MPAISLPAVAREAALHLCGDRPGVLLVGPSAQTDRVIRLILDRLAGRPILSVGFTAAGGTPAMLRQEVGAAHATRPRTDVVLLLVIAQAAALSPELLHELDLAAEAAAMHGGLKLLLAAPDDLAPALHGPEHAHLATCLRTRMIVSPPAPATVATAAEPKQDADPPAEPVPVPRIMLSITTLVLLALVLAVGLVGHMPQRARTQIDRMRSAGISLPQTIRSALRPAAPAIQTPQHPAALPFALHLPDRATQDGAANAPARKPPPPPPAASLLLLAGPGDTLPALYERVYRGTTPPPYPEVMALNPTIRPGVRLVFPAPAHGWAAAEPVR